MTQQKRLLDIIRYNARIKAHAVQQRLGLSASLISQYKKKIDWLPYAVVDYAFCNLLLFRIYIQEWDELHTAELSKHASSLYTLDGEYSICIEVLAPNPSAFNKKLQAILQLFPHKPQYMILLNIVSHYLLGQGKDVIIGGDRKPQIYSEQQETLLGAIVKEPLLAYTVLAKRLHMHPYSINKELERLPIRGIWYATPVVTRLCVAGDQQQILTLAKSMPQILEIHKVLGSVDAELHVEGDAREVMTQLRKTGARIVHRLEQLACLKRTLLSERD